jgi:5'-phosphate synthase pdxT subunit
VIAEVDGNIVGVRYGNQLGISFHPEVTDCLKMHRYFVDMVE